MTRLTDEELAVLGKFGSEMDGIDELFGNTPGSCTAIGGLVSRALAELRAMRLTDEEREALVFAREQLSDAWKRVDDPLADRALRVLAKLTRGEL